MLEVGEQGLKVDALLPHTVVSEEEPDALVHQDACIVAPCRQEAKHGRAGQPSGSLEQKWEDHNGCVEVGDEERMELLLEGTAATDVRTDGSLVRFAHLHGLKLQCSTLSSTYLRLP